ncbi:MAG: hypothetical protein J0L97_03250 [Alphaproteobacteria bacterium]|nr:hypothetical protein [Alphaproteobacteria bacterium]
MKILSAITAVQHGAASHKAQQGQANGLGQNAGAEAAAPRHSAVVSTHNPVLPKPLAVASASSGTETSATEDEVIDTVVLSEEAKGKSSNSVAARARAAIAEHPELGDLKNFGKVASLIARGLDLPITPEDPAPSEEETVAGGNVAEGGSETTSGGSSASGDVLEQQLVRDLIA